MNSGVKTLFQPNLFKALEDDLQHRGLELDFLVVAKGILNRRQNFRRLPRR